MSTATKSQEILPTPLQLTGWLAATSVSLSLMRPGVVGALAAGSIISPPIALVSIVAATSITALWQRQRQLYGKANNSEMESPSVPRHKQTLLFAGNWKMNPLTEKEASTLLSLIAAEAKALAADTKGKPQVEIAVFPPHPWLPIAQKVLKDSGVKLGGQNSFNLEKGAFTGAVGPGMLKSVGAEYVLVGHSERRTIFGDKDDAIRLKLKAAIIAGLKPVLCVGETLEEYKQGMVKEICALQLGKALIGIPQEDFAKLTIAYEPVWAIGTGLTATPAIAQSVHSYLRSWIGSRWGTNVAESIRILYGGSVTPESAEALMSCPDVDGALIGGASLSADSFAKIFTCSVPSPLPGAPKQLFAQETVPCKV